MNLGNIAKAVVGAVLAGVAPYTAALLPSSQAGGRVTVGEWLTVVVAVLVASALVWRADNVRWFKYAKATAAAGVTFLGPLVVVFLAGGAPTQADVLNALVQVAITFGVVSQVPNAGESEWHDPIGGDGEHEWDGASPDKIAADESDPAGYADAVPVVPATIEPGADGVPVLTPVDADGDGHDDRTGRWVPGNSGTAHRAIVPGGSLAFVLGGGVWPFSTTP